MHSSHNQQRSSTWKSCLFEKDVDASKFKVHRDITGAKPGPPERDPKIASLLEAAISEKTILNERWLKFRI